jgi:hypothetical protein
MATQMLEDVVFIPISDPAGIFCLFPHTPSQLASGLSSLADSFDRFHETGMEHYKAATSVIHNLQEIATVCQNTSCNTISSHVEKVHIRSCCLAGDL